MDDYIEVTSEDVHTDLHYEVSVRVTPGRYTEAVEELTQGTKARVSATQRIDLTGFANPTVVFEVEDKDVDRFMENYFNTYEAFEGKLVQGVQATQVTKTTTVTKTKSTFPLVYRNGVPWKVPF